MKESPPTSTNTTSRQKLLLLWAVSASVLSAILLGLLAFQQLLTQVTKSHSERGEVLKSVPFSSPEPEAVEDLAAADLEPPPLPPLPDIYISDLKPLRFLNGWGEPGFNKSVIGNPLTMGGKIYERGLGTHANGEAVFDIPAGARRFVAVVGLDDEVLNDEWRRGSVSFKVFGDADEPGESPVLLGTSPVLSPTTARSWAFDLELDSRFKRIELVVSDTRDGNECDHADWVNAGFLKSEGAPVAQ